MQALLNPNRVENNYSTFENLTTDSFEIRGKFFFTHFSNVITVEDKGTLSLANKAEIQNIKSFINLKHNWDSYGALPVDIKSIEKSIDFIKFVNEYGIDVYLTSPGPNEEVMVQLKNKSREIEFIFYSTKEKYVRFDDNNFIDQGDFSYNEFENMLAWIYEERR